MPSATMHRWSAKCTPSIINATSSSPVRSAAISCANAVSVPATNRREIADFDTPVAACSTLAPPAIRRVRARPGNAGSTARRASCPSPAGQAARSRKTGHRRRPRPGPVPHHRPARQVGTLRSGQLFDVGFHQLPHHRQSGRDRRRQQPLLYLAGHFGQRDRHLSRVPIPASSQCLSACSSDNSCSQRSPVSWRSWSDTRDLPSGRTQAGDRHLKRPRNPGQPRISYDLHLRR